MNPVGRIGGGPGRKPLSRFRSNGPSGRYVLERRELDGGRTETLLIIDVRNMGQVSFLAETLPLGMAYVDGADPYFVRCR